MCYPAEAPAHSATLPCSPQTHTHFHIRGGNDFIFQTGRCGNTHRGPALVALTYFWQKRHKSPSPVLWMSLDESFLVKRKENRKEIVKRKFRKKGGKTLICCVKSYCCVATSHVPRCSRELLPKPVRRKMKRGCWPRQAFSANCTTNLKKTFTTAGSTSILLSSLHCVPLLVTYSSEVLFEHHLTRVPPSLRKLTGLSKENGNR